MELIYIVQIFSLIINLPMTITTVYISHAFLIDLPPAMTITSTSYILTSPLKPPATIILLVTL